MDEIVKAAMAKWPQVPACYGWLGLDARGTWYMRDDRTQATGPFAPLSGASTKVAKGAPLLHDKLIAFIHRNYLPDDQGRWFFQNGPQRVYVELEAAPHVWRIGAAGDVESHHGVPAHVQSCWLDELGRLFLLTDRGFGLVHTQDMHEASQWVESGTWRPQPMAFAQMPERFGYRLSPAAHRAT